MNPFFLKGPQFLVFYIFLLIFLGILLYVLRTQKEAKLFNNLNSYDPYLIAYLRGKSNEVLRVVVISLIDRKLLKIQETKATLLKSAEYKLVSSNNSSINFIKDPLEKALLTKFKTPVLATSIFTDIDLSSLCKKYEDELIRMGYIPDSETKAYRIKLFIMSVCIAWVVAIIKIIVAISHGHYNVIFLITLAIIFPFVAYSLAYPYRTKNGNTALNNLKQLFSNLKDRSSYVQPGGVTNEMLMLAAVFGLMHLPYDLYSNAKKIYPKSMNSLSYGGSGCGSGSSCGSGGSCGGGGCGGGCGGCG